MNDQDDRPESPEIRPIPQIPRRALLKQLGGAAAAAALLPRLAACDDEETIPASGADASDAAGASDTAGLAPDALGADTAAADTGPGPVPALQPLRRDGSHPYDYIDTIVILQMENRSFDHYYGALSLEEGRDDVDGLVAGLTNPDASGAPVGLRRVRDLFTISPDPSHGHVASLEQWADGANDGFVRNWQKKLAADLDDEAERQARLDLVMGWYGRAELPAHYGLADAFTVCDRWFCSLLGPTWPNRFYSHAATSDGLFANLTPLESPTMFRLALDHGLTVGAYYSTLFHFAWTMKNPEPTDYYDQPLEQFFADAEAGTLPNVCIVEPDYAVDDDHPPHDTRLGQPFIQSVYEALRQSPQWDRCLFLVFYDEHGGFHDHVAPPKTAGDARAADGFDQLGFRVPGLVAGPLVKRGAVHHGVLDHASVPALVSRVFDLPFLNDRARLAGDFADLMDLELTVDAKRPAPPALPAIEVPAAAYERAHLAAFAQTELATYCMKRGLQRESERERGRLVDRRVRRMLDQRVLRLR